jgi:hypothetical protein
VKTNGRKPVLRTRRNFLQSIKKIYFIYIILNKNISPLIQLLEQIAKQQYESKDLAESQGKAQPKTSES